MRILFLNPIGNIGGAERVLLTIVSGIRREMPTSIVKVITFSDGPLLSELHRLGAVTEVLQLPAKLAQLGDSKTQNSRIRKYTKSLGGIPKLLTFTRLLKHIIADFKPDIIHSNGIKSHLLSRFALPLNVPVVWHIHDFYSLRPLAGWLLRRASSRVSIAIAISKAVAHDLEKVLPNIKVEVVLNAVDLVHYSPGPGHGEELDRLAELPNAPVGTLRVGLVATYARWKGQLCVLDAASILAKELPQLSIRWFIIGGPIYHTAAQFTEAELREYAQSRGITDIVGFIPYVKDTVSIYRSLDVVLHASTLPEPFGLTVAEAMACGRPVVVSAAGGAVELFKDSIDALGFQPGNALQFAEVVRRYAEDRDLRIRIETAARVAMEKRFDSVQYGTRIASVYLQLMKEGKG